MSMYVVDLYASDALPGTCGNRSRGILRVPKMRLEESSGPVSAQVLKANVVVKIGMAILTAVTMVNCRMKMFDLLLAYAGRPVPAKEIDEPNDDMDDVLQQ